MEPGGEVLITGGTGFVGPHLRQELARRGWEPVVFPSSRTDLTDRRETAERFAAHQEARALVHLAAWQAAGTFPAEHPAEQLAKNSLIHVNVLEAWRAFLPGAKLIAVGSSCAYPDGTPPFREEDYLAGPIHGSVHAYAQTRRLLYTGVKSYNDQYGLDGTFLIPATMYGEGDDFCQETAHVCGALVARFVRARREGRERVTVWGDGGQVRDFMDVKEFARVVAELLPRCRREVLNVAPGRGTTIGDLARTIAAAAGYEGELHFDRERYAGVREKYLDASRLAERFGLTVSADHAPGLARTATWYDTHYEQLKNRRKFG